MRIKHIIGILLMFGGLLAAIGTIGRLDYLDEIGERYSQSDVNRAAVKCVISLGVSFVGMLLCHDYEADGEDNPEEHEEKENRTDR